MSEEHPPYGPEQDVEDWATIRRLFEALASHAPSARLELLSFVWLGTAATERSEALAVGNFAAVRTRQLEQLNSLRRVLERDADLKFERGLYEDLDAIRQRLGLRSEDDTP